MKRTAAAATALLLFSCDPAVRQTVTLTFNDAADLVTISATTTLGRANPGTPEAARIDDEREALLAGRDQWSVRFANANPESDRIVMQRTRGQLQSLEHVATIPAGNLQKFFFDTPLSITMIRGEGWVELTIVPGTSTRATRLQRQRVDKTVERYSERAAAYFRAVHSMYRYLDEKPRRAMDLFVAVFRDEDKEWPRISRAEQSLTGNVRAAIDSLMDKESGEADDHEFDLVFNPFPADLRIVLSSEPLAVEGFTKTRDGSLWVKPPTPLEAVGALEGTWISPDPLAAMLAAGEKEGPEQLAASLAGLPRHSEPVAGASDIASAMVETMQPAARYRVRWIIKANAAPSAPRPPRPGSSEGERTSG